MNNDGIKTLDEALEALRVVHEELKESRKAYDELYKQAKELDEMVKTMKEAPEDMVEKKEYDKLRDELRACEKSNAYMEDELKRVRHAHEVTCDFCDKYKLEIQMLRNRSFWRRVFNV